MQSFVAAQANTMELDLVAKASGNPITSGTVNFYLRAKSGTNVGKWFRGSDDSWQAAEAIAKAATHVSDGHWTVEIEAAAWIAEVRYSLYAKEDGDLHIAYSDEVVEVHTPSEVSFEATVAS